MLFPKFIFSPKDTLYVQKGLYSNGHWMITDAGLSNFAAPSILKKQNFKSLKDGNYCEGIKNLPTSLHMDISKVIPKRDDYTLLTQPTRIKFESNFAIKAYVYIDALGKSEIGVNIDYIELLCMGHAFAKNKTSPILILDSQNLNGELLGLLMPMRL